jgi:hypothetical protein
MSSRTEKLVFRASCRDAISANVWTASFSTPTGRLHSQPSSLTRSRANPLSRSEACSRIPGEYYPSRRLTGWKEGTAKLPRPVPRNPLGPARAWARRVACVRWDPARASEGVNEALNTAAELDLKRVGKQFVFVVGHAHLPNRNILFLANRQQLVPG